MQSGQSETVDNHSARGQLPSFPSAGPVKTCYAAPDGASEALDLLSLIARTDSTPSIAGAASITASCTGLSTLKLFLTQKQLDRSVSQKIPLPVRFVPMDSERSGIATVNL